MPPDSERPIERLLRSRAKQRREAAGSRWELHPANRRNLQHEVSQQYGKRRHSTAAAPATWIRSWKIVLGGLTALIVTLGIVWLALAPREQDNKLLARNDSADRQNRRAMTEPASAPPIVEQELKDSSGEARLAESKPKPTEPVVNETTTSAAAPAESTPPALAKEELALNAPVPAPDNSPADAAAPGSQLAGRYGFGGATPMKALPPGPRLAAADAFRQGPAPVAPAPVSPAPPEVQLEQNAALTSNELKAPAIQYGVFAAQAPGARQRSATKLDSLKSTSDSAKKIVTGTPLSQFRIERDGSNLRVIDSDGSVYSGLLQTASVALARGALATESLTRRHTLRDETKTAQIAATAPIAKSQPNTTDLAFRVEGTNLTLRLPVVFSGTLILPKQWSDLATDSAAGITATPTAVISPSRVSGTVLVGKAQPFPLDAQPVKPPATR